MSFHCQLDDLVREQQQKAPAGELVNRCSKVRELICQAHAQRKPERPTTL